MNPIVVCIVSLALSAPAAALAGDSREGLAVGDPAPPFSLVGSDGRTWSLEDLRGKQGVVLAWFPKAFTGG